MFLFPLAKMLGFIFKKNKHIFSHCILPNICVAHVNIMLTLITLNGVYALLDVAIINPTQKKMVSWVANSWRMATMMMAQGKDGL